MGSNENEPGQPKPKRRNRSRTLSERERKLVRGVVAGKTVLKAAMDAGYSPMTARKNAYSYLQRPLVKSALTDALERVGVTYERMIQPVADALNATKLVAKGRETLDGKVTEYVEVEDHAIRLAAHDRAVALVGAIPKVGEGTPAAHGLNLIITAVAAQPTQADRVPRVVSEAPTAPSSPAPRAMRLTVEAAPSAAQNPQHPNGHA